MFKVIFAIVVLLIVCLGWWFIFRGAMKYPNHGNEFSSDHDPTGSRD